MKDIERAKRAQEYLRKKQSHQTKHVTASSNLQSRLKERCKCGSGKPFKSCCFRPDHQVYNLSAYFKRLKSIKERINTRVTTALLTRYKNGDPSITKAADELSEAMGAPRLVPLAFKAAEGEKSAILTASIHYEALVLDQVLPGHGTSIFMEFAGKKTSPNNPLEEQFITSYAGSKISIYEVIAVKSGNRSGKNSWFLLRDKFSGSTHEFKDPLFTGMLQIWDIVIGRPYFIDNFMIFSTSVLTIPASEVQLFDRLLLLCWGNAVVYSASNESIEILDNLERQFATSFKEERISLAHVGLYGTDLRQFLSTHSWIVKQVHDLLLGISRDFPPLMKAPDGNPVELVTIKARIKPGCGGELLERFKSEPKHFEVHDDENEQDFSIAYLVDVTGTIPDNKPVLEFATLRNLPPHEFARALGMAYQRTFVIGSTSVALDESDQILASKAMHMIDKKRVHGGSVSREGDFVEIFTYSRAAMPGLEAIVRQIAGDLITSFSAPEYNNEFETLGPKKRLLDDLQTLQEIGNDVETDIDEGDESEHEHVDLDENQTTMMNLSKAVERKMHLLWLDQPLPALKGKTPRESVEIPEIRPILIDLAKEMDNANGRNKQKRKFPSYIELLGLGEYSREVI
ncbi:MAG TPA: hypothetical protein VKM55_25230 [Candidatus Lokiarchaeia archaeon]|nr:hypothetical protein [Candidatus Lokiarchaeia archaeon]